MKYLDMYLIDIQNDFMDSGVGGNNETPQLGVPGATETALKTAAFIDAHPEHIKYLTATMDSHPSYAIERVTFWKNMAPFTLIKSGDFAAGKYELMDNTQDNRDFVLLYLRRLEDSGQTLCVWPVHGVDGSWGSAIQYNVLQSISKWESSTFSFCDRVHKGQCGLTEQYGAVRANVVLATDQRTQVNNRMVQNFKHSGSNVYAVFQGQAASHCVPATVFQLLEEVPEKASFTIWVKDGSNCVPGFEDSFESQLSQLVQMGVKVMTYAELSDFCKE